MRGIIRKITLLADMDIVIAETAYRTIRLTLRALSALSYTPPLLNTVLAPEATEVTLPRGGKSTDRELSAIHFGFQ